MKSAFSHSSTFFRSFPTLKGRSDRWFASSRPFPSPSSLCVQILTKWTENSGERDIGIVCLNPTISSNLTNGREWPASLNPQLSRRDDCFDWMRSGISAPHPTNTVFCSFSCRSFPVRSYTLSEILLSQRIHTTVNKKKENKAERKINKKIRKVRPFARFCFVFVLSGFYLEIAFMRPDNGSYVSGIGNQDLKKF